MANSDNGAIPFAQYMEQVLYEPNLGYYHQIKPAMGRQGDFITSVQLGDAFAWCLSEFIHDTYRNFLQSDCAASLKLPFSIMEIGPGTGTLAATLIPLLQQRKINVENYFFIESNPNFATQQVAKIREIAPHINYYCFNKLQQFHEQKQLLPFCGCIIANELLDALPVEIFSIKNNQHQETDIKQAYVKPHNSPTNQQPFDWHWQAATANIKQAVLALNKRLNGLTANMIGELSTQLPAMVKDIAQTLHYGSCLFVDYGHHEHILYHPQRTMGTLSCHQHHLRHDNPFYYPGLQDLTAHVDFSFLAREAQTSKLTLLGYSTQAQFLMEHGLLDYLQKNVMINSPEQRLAIKEQITYLTDPNHMGETFKVMAFSSDKT